MKRYISVSFSIRFFVILANGVILKIVIYIAKTIGPKLQDPAI